MKKIPFYIFLFINFFGFSQTVKLDINAVYAVYSDVYDKVFVAVHNDDPHYSAKLIQLNPYTGIVDRYRQIGGNAKKLMLTSDHSHLYVSFYNAHILQKVDLSSFDMASTIYAGDNDFVDFTVSPINENHVFVVLGDGNYPDKIVMYKDEIHQPKQIICDFNGYASYLSIKSNGQQIYAHNGTGSSHQGYIIEIVDDGIVCDGVGWENMIGSFYEIKSHNNLVFGNKGHIVDPYSDSIPLMEAIMPVTSLTNSTRGFDYSEYHGCFIYGHETEYKGYISFFHGQHYNYLGSLKVTDTTEYIYDVDVVDENHFVLISLNVGFDYDNSLLLYTVEPNGQPQKNTIYDGVNTGWFESHNLVRLPAIKSNISK